MEGSLRAPHIEKLTVDHAAVAAGSDATREMGEAQGAGFVQAAKFIPVAAMTGNSTDSRTLTIVNKKQDGSGTDVVATLAFTAGVNGVANDVKSFTVDDAKDAIAAGDVLALVSTHVGSTGLADPGGEVTVEIARQD